METCALDTVPQSLLQDAPLGRAASLATGSMGLQHLSRADLGPPSLEDFLHSEIVQSKSDLQTLDQVPLHCRMRRSEGQQAWRQGLQACSI